MRFQMIDVHLQLVRVLMVSKSVDDGKFYCSEVFWLRVQMMESSRE